MVAVISIVGKSNSGKTTLLEGLIAQICKRGYKAGTIKHSVKGFDIDYAGKDSWRHKQSGARSVVISSPFKLALIMDLEKEMSIDDIVLKYLNHLDIVFTEGYKKNDKPKIEVIKEDGRYEDILCKYDKNLIAVVTDIKLETPVPCFRHDEITLLTDFIEKMYLHRKDL